VRSAAVNFTRDYSAWESGRLVEIPPNEATPRVTRLLEHE
jgi:hypothetical protein